MNNDLISREALKEHKFLSPDNPNATRFYNETTKAYQKGWNDCIDAIIDNAPTVEERPQGEITEEDIQNAIKAGYENGYSMAQAKYQRPQGEWINHRNDYGHNIADCSLCGKAMQWHDKDEDGIPRYCWYCGADMRGKEE